VASGPDPLRGRSVDRLRRGKGCSWCGGSPATRVARYGLRLHPEKTRLVPFQIPRDKEKLTQSNGPGAFTFLGFTHSWGKSRKGNWVVKRKTASSRFTRSLSRVRQWCRRWRHEPVAWQQRQLSRGLRGHYAYYGITGLQATTEP